MTAADSADLAITTPSHLDGCGRVRRLIIARCPELTEGEIAAAYATEPDPGASIWLEIGEQVLDVLGALDERLVALERTINGEQDDDDDDERDRA